MIKRKGDKLFAKWKGYDNSFNSWKNKINLELFYYTKMSKFYPKPYKSFGKSINVKVNLSNYATKTDIKNISHD